MRYEAELTLLATIGRKGMNQTMMSMNASKRSQGIVVGTSNRKIGGAPICDLDIPP
jgi:hypothetical protein